MQTETIIVLAVILFVILFLFLHGLAKVRESIEQISKDVKMEKDKNWHDEPVNETKPTPVHSKPFPIQVVVDTALKESKKVLDAAAKAKQNAEQQALNFTVEPEAHRPRDPNKPKRKSPVPHNRVNNKDEFWHEVIREYFTMKKKNPTLTRADFVRMKDDPRIKAKTFNSKLHYMSKYGALPHKAKKQ